MDPVQPGLACGSDTAHLSIFGYDPRHVYCGRGSFECMGAGKDTARLLSPSSSTSSTFALSYTFALN